MTKAAVKAERVLHVFESEVEQVVYYVVARDADDAKGLYRQKYRRREAPRFKQVPDEQELGFDDGPHSMAVNTCRHFADTNGRGFLYIGAAK